MKLSFFTCLLFSATLALSQTAIAQSMSGAKMKIQNALSSAPPSITENATVMDWPSEEGGEMTVLRKGSSEWTCFPSMPHTPGNDPMCVDKPWLEWIDAWANKREPNITRMGFGYMLQANDSPYSNKDPYAEGPTPNNEWQETDVPHLMILVPNKQALAGLPTDPNNGGPWVMFRDTPYVHIMAPMPRYLSAEK